MKEEGNVTVLAQLHIWHKSRTFPGSSICTVACLLCHCLVTPGRGEVGELLGCGL